jgi:diguanylate cyclase (GGDEF)-like protein
VLPAWYQTPWFRLAALALVALLVAALVQMRTALLRQRQRELERQVAERTAELSLTQAQLRHFAYVDMLTGLPNRRAFTEEFRRLIEEAQLTKARLALLLIDMDGFKLVNDTLGHHAGDSLLVAVGGRLRGAVREGDYVARLGGDEFAVLLMLEDDVIELVCQRIIDGFLPPVAIEGENLIAGASIGVAIYPDHGVSQERIYKMADIAMYAAKREGRGTWRCFERTMQAA